MKKLIIMLMFLSVGIIGANAQITGGGKGTKTKSKTKSQSDNVSYIKFGYSAPAGKFKDPFAGGSFNDEIDIKGMNALAGASFQLGTMYYFKNISFLPTDAKMGLDVTYLYSGVSFFSWEMFGSDNQDLGVMIFGGPSIGPVFSYNPYNELVIDAYFKLNILFSLFTYHESQYNDSDWFTDEQSFDITGLSVGNKFTLGTNVRYNNFILGLEFMFGKLNYNINQTYDVWFAGDSNNYTNDYKTAVPTNVTNLSIGFSF